MCPASSIKGLTSGFENIAIDLPSSACSITTALLESSFLKALFS